LVAEFQHKLPALLLYALYTAGKPLPQYFLLTPPKSFKFILLPILLFTCKISFRTELGQYIEMALTILLGHDEFDVF
jgi:hypothetical protein